MSARLDTSPQARLRRLAASLRLNESDIERALRMNHGDVAAAERTLHEMLRPAARLAATRAAAHTPLTREERISKCALALAATPDALDILHLSLTKALQQPHVEKYRKVNVDHGVFKERVSSKNAAGVELLHAVGFEPMYSHLVLQKHDPALLSHALAALGGARLSATYVDRKAAAADEQARNHAAEQGAAADAERRAAFAAKVPSEPPEGGDGRASTAVITVKVGADSAAAACTRRFNSDDTLDDLCNYVRSLPDAPLGAMRVENVTTRPTRLFDLGKEGACSLYALDLWPRGKVLVTAAA